MDGDIGQIEADISVTRADVVALWRWMLEVDVPAGLATDGTGAVVRTDTGHLATGLPPQALAEGSVFRLLLHPDTTELIFSTEVGQAGTAQVLPLPATVLAHLTGASPCRPDTLVVRLDDDLNADLTAAGC